MAYLAEEIIDEPGPQGQVCRFELARAERLFRSFAGCAPGAIAARSVKRVPQVLVDLGALRGLIYAKDHGGARNTYIHFMESPPRLACDADGKQLYVLGGNYRITRRGIEG